MGVKLEMGSNPEVRGYPPRSPSRCDTLSYMSNAGDKQQSRPSLCDMESSELMFDDGMSTLDNGSEWSLDIPQLGSSQFLE